MDGPPFYQDQALSGTPAEPDPALPDASVPAAAAVTAEAVVRRPYPLPANPLTELRHGTADETGDRPLPERLRRLPRATALVGLSIGCDLGPTIIPAQLIATPNRIPKLTTPTVTAEPRPVASSQAA
jgi:hypothetical protein